VTSNNVGDSIANIGVNDSGTALRADTGRDVLNYKQLALYPQVLLDKPLFHLFAAVVALTVIVHSKHYR
jgi:hypothetical protein